MAEFLAQRVYEEHISFEDVPDKLKPQVRKILHDKYKYNAC